MIYKIVKELSLVEDYINREVRSDDNFISKLVEHLKTGHGKLLRPSLLILSNKATGKIKPETIPLASALEIIHLASLLHDDVIDKSILRRGKRTINALWGDKISILLGDYLYARASLIITKNSTLRIRDIVSSTIKDMCEGEINETKNSYNLNLSETTYTEIISKKTASLFSASCKIGAVLSEKDEVSDELADFGYNLGVAFQIIDDTLDYTSDKKNTGKSSHSDILNGKITLPVIVALNRALPEDRRTLNRFFTKKDKDIFGIKKIIKKYDTIDYAFEKASYYCEAGIKSLQKLPDSEYKKKLIDISNSVLLRR